ncbi:DNA alkylation repair protein [Actinomyces bowdenii]|uniref:DNA alkylation repair protein n=1 Tax=Actinomyces bowdenii TaxID=131109 RepID=A0A853EQB4_9ACTO|nr:DNA alkylation repair protein [Actinomyces bowdenii]MBF0697723.1 DNA alkylation repair protein [Actinomyces bowdenii]NYS69896.1 DNA alkylation repair protein [Actinomyces bowdenii]
MSRASLSPDRLAELNGGGESRTLGEILVISHARLLAAVLPEAPEGLRDAARSADSLGILARMRAMGRALHTHMGPQALIPLAAHASDTVRGWAVFAQAAAWEERQESITGVLASVRGAADDPHFGVREWAWLAARPQLAGSLDEAVAALVPWTADPSERIRRFASESLRPRGVWAPHIPDLKEDPERGRALLEPLRADESRYVQDSVANWINDAAKTRPDWAGGLCRQWLSQEPGPATRRIVTRGLRSLRP